MPDPYVSVDDLRVYLKLQQSDQDGQLEEALVAACGELDGYCARTFSTGTVASARVYRPRTTRRHGGWTVAVDIDDAHTITTVEVDTAADGTYAATTTAYLTEPINGIVDGIPGWPATMLLFLDGPLPALDVRPSVQVTAEWGWAECPAPVKQATRILSAELWKLGTAPLGITDQIGDFGALRIGRSAAQRAKTLLAPYRRADAAVLIA